MNAPTAQITISWVFVFSLPSEVFGVSSRDRRLVGVKVGVGDMVCARWWMVLDEVG